MSGRVSSGSHNPPELPRLLDGRLEGLTSDQAELGRCQAAENSDYGDGETRMGASPERVPP